MSDKVKRVQIVQYDGSIESYNKLVEYLWDKEAMHIWFLDEEGSSTPVFTGVVACAKSGIIYRPGDYYAKNAENFTGD